MVKFANSCYWHFANFVDLVGILRANFGAKFVETLVLVMKVNCT
jgi:hypothetical protein